MSCSKVIVNLCHCVSTCAPTRHWSLPANEWGRGRPWIPLLLATSTPTGHGPPLLHWVGRGRGSRIVVPNFGLNFHFTVSSGGAVPWLLIGLMIVFRCHVPMAATGLSTGLIYKVILLAILVCKLLTWLPATFQWN